MRIQSLFVVDVQEGDVLVEKHWQKVTERSVVDWYLRLCAEAPGGAAGVESVLKAPEHYVFSLARSDVSLLATAQAEMPPLLALEFLVRVADVLEDYLGGAPLCASKVRSHFVVVYQLLEEMMDSGMPFTTEANILKGLVAPPNLLNKLSSVMSGKGGVSASAELPEGAQSSVPWRRTGVRYAQNEVLFDIVESVDAVIDADNRVVTGSILGDVVCSCRLSGTPDVSLSFENPHLVEDVSFHPCVRYNKWGADRVLSFVPPDGTFKLASFSVRPHKGSLPLPIYVRPQLSFQDRGGRINVMVGPRTDLGRPAEGIVVKVPLPSFVQSVDLGANVGQVSYAEQAREVTWLVGRIPKDRSPMLSGTLVLSPEVLRQDDTHQLLLLDQAVSVEVAFRVPGVSLSGLSVASVAVTREQYKAHKAVRYTAQSGHFVVRT